MSRYRELPWIILLASLSLRAFAASPEINFTQVFQFGNQLYSQGNFKGAIEQYLKIAQTGFANESVYYNLANAYFKDNQIGKAILYYEKARELAPGDQDILENLDFARTRIVDKVENPPEGFLSKQLDRLLTFLPVDMETALAVGLFIIANGFFTLFVLGKSDDLRRVSLFTSGSLLILFLMVGTFNAFRIYELETTRDAVILAEKADVVSGPGEDNPTLFSIHEGLKVKVQNELNQWAQISLENGWTGWVKQDVLGMI
jgi:tetratricopeptide (TPR) repeat protein